MMAALAGVVKEDDKDIARKLFKAGDINKQVEEVSKSGLSDFLVVFVCLARNVTTHVGSRGYES